jgi:hypothetical protein
MIRICTDFTAREGGDPHGGGRVPLDLLGSFRDMRRQNVELHEGLRIIIYENDIEAEAIVEMSRGKWYGRLVGPIIELPENEQNDQLLGYDPLVPDPAAQSMGENAIRIWADFNALNGDLIPLDSKVSLADIRRQNVELHEGMGIIVYEKAIQAAAMVEKHQGRWHGRLVGNITIVPMNERRYPKED